jgi:hypothetical protein
MANFETINQGLGGSAAAIPVTPAQSWYVALTDDANYVIGTTAHPLVVTAASGSLSTNLTQVGGSPISLGQTVMTGSLPIVVASNQPSALFSGVTAPGYGVVGGAVYATSFSPLASGDASYSQCDAYGNLFVRPFRRSQTVATPTTIASSSSATSIMASQGAGVYADISNLVITPTAQATGVAFTATLSDGTSSFVYDMNTGSTTALVPEPPINVNFNPPLPATSAATAWTLTLSSSSVTVHVTCVAVLQKAS